MQAMEIVIYFDESLQRLSFQPLKHRHLLAIQTEATNETFRPITIPIHIIMIIIPGTILPICPVLMTLLNCNCGGYRIGITSRPAIRLLVMSTKLCFLSQMFIHVVLKIEEGSSLDKYNGTNGQLSE